MARYSSRPSPGESAVKWTETYTMAVFYYGTHGDDWALKLGFIDPVTDVCNWNIESTDVDSPIQNQGASCGSDGRINRLEIYSRHALSGTIPSEFGLLTDMEYLRLSFAGLSGSLPEALGSLTKLRELNVEGNALSGTIPEEYRSLSSLVTFNVQGCSTLSGTIPDWIGAWTALTALKVSENMLTGVLPASLSELTNLEELALDGNQISGDVVVLEDLVKLKHLYLERNNFAQDINNAFLDRIEQLEHLDISNNDFEGTVPVHLMNLDSLLVMDVNSNKFSEFPDEIPEGNKVQMLTIHRNPIAGIPFPSSVAHLTDLAHLDITSTDFTGTMPDFLGDLTKLRYLFMADTSFDQGPIPDTYQTLEKLRDLSLKHSYRTGAIPVWLEDLDELVLLDLDNNELTGEIPSGLTDISSLFFLLLNRNKLEGTLPAEFGHASNLWLLLLDHNNITGSLDPFCSLQPAFGATADCKAMPEENGTSAGSMPEVNCTCCKFCCNDYDPEPCNTDDRLAQYDPKWQDGYSGVYFSDFSKDYEETPPVP